MLEMLIRENGVERWVDMKTLRSLSGSPKKKISPIVPLDKVKTLKGFGEWYALYNKKTTKKNALDFWSKYINEDKVIRKIMEHTRHYIKNRDKVYRKDPIRYLRDKVYEDEIIKAEVKIDLDLLYPFDKSGNSRLGRCSKCNSIVFGNKFTITKDDSDCCKVKIKQYR